MIDPPMLHLKLYMIRKEKELIKEERTFRRTSVRTAARRRGAIERWVGRRAIDKREKRNEMKRM